MKEDKIYKLAKRRAYAKIVFYIHFAVYALVIAAVAIINLTFTPQFWWFLFPALGWGIGLGIQGAIVFIALNTDLKRRLIENEMRRLNATAEASVGLPPTNYLPMNWRDV